MRLIIVMIFLLIGTVSFAQTSFLKDAVVKLEKALIAKDTVVLKQLLHRDATYGHSNGWVESKTDVVKDLVTNKLTYHTIESKELKWKVTGSIATVRSAADITFTLDGKQGDLHLHVLQVWLKSGGRWQLLARQSTKI